MIFSYYKQISNYDKPTSHVTITWQGHIPNMIFMQGHPGKSPSYHQIWSRMVKPANDIHMEIYSTNNREEFFRAACKGKIRAASDASYMPQYSSSIAAAAWRVKTTQGSCSWKGYGIFSTTYNSFYGGELYGIYLIMRFLDIMWPNQTASQGCILIKCDNLAGINDFSKEDLKLSRSKNFPGLLRAIRRLKQEFRIHKLLTMF